MLWSSASQPVPVKAARTWSGGYFWDREESEQCISRFFLNLIINFCRKHCFPSPWLQGVAVMSQWPAGVFGKPRPA